MQVRKFAKWFSGLFCRHQKIRTAIWHHNDWNEFGPTGKWDGAYHYYCIKCKKWDAELHFLDFDYGASVAIASVDGKPLEPWLSVEAFRFRG